MADDTPSPTDAPAPASAAPADPPPTQTAPLLTGQPPGETAQPAPTEQPKDQKAGEQPAKPITADDYDFAIPEGLKADDTAIGDFKALAAEMGLSKEQAQKLVDFRGKQAAAQMQEHVRALDHQNEQWVQAATSDKEYGGQKLQQNLAIADRAIAEFGSNELRAMMHPYHPTQNPTGMGLGNHPEIIRAFYRAGLKITEPGPVHTGNPGGGHLDHAEILYPSK